MPVPRSAPDGAPRLRPALSDVPDAPVTVVCAPSGFGKTALLRQWRDAGTDLVLVTARPADAGPAEGFWLAVVDALVATGHEVPAHLVGGPSRLTAERLLALAAPVTLAVDGMDAAPPDLGRDLVDLASAAAGLRLVLAGRSPAWWPETVPEDAAAGVEVRMIGPAELALTRREVAGLLAQRAPHLATSPYWSGLIHRSTGGWPAVVAAVVRRMARSEPDPVALSAIASRAAAEEVRRRLLPELADTGDADLAMATAVAGHFTAAIAESATGAPAAAVQRLAARGLLAVDLPTDPVDDVVVDLTGGEIRYHWPDTARAVLLDELAHRDPGGVTALRTAWARAHLRCGQYAAAAAQAAAARAWSLLVVAVEAGWRELLRDGGAGVRDALAAAPVDALAGSPRSLALREIVLLPAAWSHDGDRTDRGRTDGGRAHRGHTDGSDGASPAPPLPALPETAAGLARIARGPRVADVLDTGLAVVAAHHHAGRHAAALDHAHRLLAIASDAATFRPAEVAPHRPAIHLAVGVGLLVADRVPAAITALEQAHRAAAPAGRSVTASAAGLLAMLHATLGETGAARRWRETLRGLDAPAPWRPAATHLHVAEAVADLLVAVDDLDPDAARAAHRRLALLDPAESPWLDLWAFAEYAAARYALHFGDVAAALDGIDRAVAAHRRHSGDGISGRLVTAATVDLLTAAGRAHQAARLLGHSPHRQSLQLPAARLALLSGDTAGAASIATDATWDRHASTGDRLQMRLILAVAAHRRGNRTAGLDALAAAARIAASSGIRSAWSTVPSADLAALARDTPLASFVPDPVVTEYRGVFPCSVELIDLSDRELHVLDQVAAGATLGQAAAALTISPNTVKTHLASIYRKLNVTSRAAAVVEARRLGVLSGSTSRSSYSVAMPIAASLLDTPSLR